MNRWNRSEKK